MTTSAPQKEYEYKEYTLTMTLKVHPEMRESRLRDYIHSQIFTDNWPGAFNTNYIHSTDFQIQSRPAPSPQFNSTELLLLAHDEWKRRQERKHLDDEAAWVSGFINGFLTDKKWAREYLDKMRGEP